MVIMMMTWAYESAGLTRSGAKKVMWAYLEAFDVHKWVWAFEKGKGGLKHIQARFSLSMEETEARTSLMHWFPKEHSEKASDVWEYERKEGRFVASTDTNGARSQRFGKMHPWQEALYQRLKKQNDRQVMVLVDEEGNMGKSWMAGHLWEIGKAHVVLPSNTAKGLVQDVASEFIHNGNRPIVIIDIPRTWRWTEELCYCIEMVKDGLIKDARYQSRTINIHGVKVLITCNEAPKTKYLSEDRWEIWKGTDWMLGTIAEKEIKKKMKEKGSATGEHPRNPPQGDEGQKDRLL